MEGRELSGGTLLRAIRERRGRSQLEVEAEAQLGTGYLQRLELDKIRQPTRAVLVRLLDALGASYPEQSGVMRRFGYAAATPLPGVEELAWAARTVEESLHGTVFPACLIDCALRIVVWNEGLVRLFGNIPATRVLHYLRGRSLIHLIFDPRYGLLNLLDAEHDLPALTQLIRHELLLYRGERWYHELIEHALEELPLFHKYWGGGRYSAHLEPACTLIELSMALPDGRVRFRIVTNQFSSDPRFRVVFYIPADVATFECCQHWHQMKRTWSQEAA